MVTPGQSFWSIAASVLESRHGSSPSPAQIAPYWKALVRSNATIVATTGDPDRIYSGQVVVLPAG